MMKTKQDKDMIEYIGMVYTETKTKLLGPIWPCVVYDEN